MFKSLLVIPAFGLFIGFAACTPLYENIYERVQMQKRQEAPPNVDAPEPEPGYDEYLRQRREVVMQPAPEIIKP